MVRRSESRFLELRALAALEHMRFTTRHRIDGAYSGRHLSRQLGGAGEFVDFREYTPGDDLRRLDWKVLARTGRSYLRLYQDETNLMCTLLVDASGSMRFGGLKPTKNSAAGSKLEHVQYLATALAHLISQGQDQVGLAVVADKLREFVPPGSSPDHVARLHDTIARLSTWPATRMGDALRDLFQRLTRRSVLMVMSDFLFDDLDDAFSALRLYRKKHWEIVLLHIVHPHEETLPTGRAYRFDGLENEGHVRCSPTEIKREYERRFAEHCAAVRSMALATGCDYRRVSTATHYLQTLSGFLVERAG